MRNTTWNDAKLWQCAQDTLYQYDSICGLCIEFCCMIMCVSYSAELFSSSYPFLSFVLLVVLVLMFVAVVAVVVVVVVVVVAAAIMVVRRFNTYLMRLPSWKRSWERDIAYTWFHANFIRFQCIPDHSSSIKHPKPLQESCIWEYPKHSQKWDAETSHTTIQPGLLWEWGSGNFPL